MRAYAIGLIAVFLAVARTASAVHDGCEVCGAEIHGSVYMCEDKVAHVKKRLCGACSKLISVCYMCGMPVLKDFTTLPDTRVLCARDARTVVVREEDAVEICKQTKDTLDRLLARFITFPETNITIALADRVNMMNLFQVPGQDYECPNILGYIKSKTNGASFTHDISLLSGLPGETLKSTYVHECTHAWVAENVSRARAKQLNRSAEEGFCELVSYLVMDALGSEEAKKAIKLNGYTRGQFDLFLAAEERYGFNDIADWMRYGEDAALWADDLGRVHNVELPARTAAAAVTVKAATPKPVVARAVPEVLTLQGIIWSKTRPMALINNLTFAPNDESSVSLGQTKVKVRCVTIREDSVVVQVAGTAEPQTLRLGSK